MNTAPTIFFKDNYVPLRKFNTVWKKECPFCFVPLEITPTENNLRISVKIIDKKDEKEKIMEIPRYLVKEMYKVHQYESEKAKKSVAWFRRMWCKLMKKPVLNKDPMEGKIFEITRDDTHRFSMFSVKTKEDKNV